jgi:phospholipase C
MGYHDWHEIPNYWNYARNFVLQDHMFEAVNSWSLPAHLSMVSGWAARCSKHHDPMSCKPALKSPFGATGHGQKLDYPWTDLTYLLHRHHVSWRYYVANGSQPDCADSQMFCRHVPQGASTPGIWNPLPRFDTVQQDHQLGNIQPLGDFYRAARKGTLAAVTWITPSQGVSEHPPSLVTAGQTWVTRLINTIMSGPNWKSTAIFLAWDDWGGFYDHVKPRRVDGEGYGIRVPSRDQPVRQTGLRRPPGPRPTRTSSSSRTTSCTAGDSTRAPTGGPTRGPTYARTSRSSATWPTTSTSTRSPGHHCYSRSTRRSARASEL